MTRSTGPFLPVVLLCIVMVAGCVGEQTTGEPPLPDDTDASDAPSGQHAPGSDVNQNPESAEDSPGSESNSVNQTEPEYPELPTGTFRAAFPAMKQHMDVTYLVAFDGTQTERRFTVSPGTSFASDGRPVEALLLAEGEMGQVSSGHHIVSACGSHLWTYQLGHAQEQDGRLGSGLPWWLLWPGMDLEAPVSWQATDSDHPDRPTLGDVALQLPAHERSGVLLLAPDSNKTLYFTHMALSSAHRDDWPERAQGDQWWFLLNDSNPPDVRSDRAFARNWTLVSASMSGDDIVACQDVPEASPGDAPRVALQRLGPDDHVGINYPLHQLLQDLQETDQAPGVSALLATPDAVLETWQANSSQQRGSGPYDWRIAVRAGTQWGEATCAKTDLTFSCQEVLEEVAAIAWPEGRTVVKHDVLRERWERVKGPGAWSYSWFQGQDILGTNRESLSFHGHGMTWDPNTGLASVAQWHVAWQPA